MGVVDFGIIFDIVGGMSGNAPTHKQQEALEMLQGLGLGQIDLSDVPVVAKFVQDAEVQVDGRTARVVMALAKTLDSNGEGEEAAVLGRCLRR